MPRNGIATSERMLPVPPKTDRSSKRVRIVCCLLLWMTGLIGDVQAASTASVSFVQVAAATPQSPVESVAVTYPHAQTAGDLNLVVVGWNDTSATVQSVTDSLGNSYTLAVGPTKGTGLTQSIYYAQNVLGGSNSVTVRFSQAAASPDIRILEYRGLSTTAPLDVTAEASGTSGSNEVVSSGVATTTSASELIFGAGMTSGAFSEAGTSFTAEVITAPDGDIAEDEKVSATGSYAATADLGAYGSQNWIMQMVTLMASGASGTTPTGDSAPTISSVSPSSGSSSGGTAVTITGTNFVAGATVTFGGTAASNVTVSSSTSITATTPAHAAGAVNVVVSDSNGSGTLTNGFTYIQNEVILSWQASSSANVTSYDVYRSTVSGGYYGLVGSTAGVLSYADTTVQSGTTYYYVVTAVNSQGEQSGYSNQVVATVPSP